MCDITNYKDMGHPGKGLYRRQLRAVLKMISTYRVTLCEWWAWQYMRSLTYLLIGRHHLWSHAKSTYRWVYHPPPPSVRALTWVIHIFITCDIPHTLIYNALLSGAKVAYSPVIWKKADYWCPVITEGNKWLGRLSCGSQ